MTAESEAGRASNISGMSAASGTKSDIAGISKEHVHELQENASEINKLTNEFDGFYESLEKEIDAKKAAEKAKFEALKARVTNVENNVKSESKRMTDSLAALQTLFETSIAKVQTKLEKQIETTAAKFDTKVYKLTERLAKLETEVARSGKEYKKEFEQLQETLTQKIDENSKGLEVERKARIADHEVALRKIDTEAFKATEALEAEKVTRETREEEARDDVEKSFKLRDKASESTNKEIFAKLEEVKTMIKSEEEVRRAADEQFLATLNEYMRALKTGLKRVT